MELTDACKKRRRREAGASALTGYETKLHLFGSERCKRHKFPIVESRAGKLLRGKGKLTSNREPPEMLVRNTGWIQFDAACARRGRRRGEGVAASVRLKSLDKVGTPVQ